LVVGIYPFYEASYATKLVLGALVFSQLLFGGALEIWGAGRLPKGAPPYIAALLFLVATLRGVPALRTAQGAMAAELHLAALAYAVAFGLSTAEVCLQGFQLKPARVYRVRERLLWLWGAVLLRALGWSGAPAPATLLIAAVVPFPSALTLGGVTLPGAQLAASAVVVRLEPLLGNATALWERVQPAAGGVTRFAKDVLESLLKGLLRFVEELQPVLAEWLPRDVRELPPEVWIAAVVCAAYYNNEGRVAAPAAAASGSSSQRGESEEEHKNKVAVKHAKALAHGDGGGRASLSAPHANAVAHYGGGGGVPLSAPPPDNPQLRPDKVELRQVHVTFKTTGPPDKVVLLKMLNKWLASYIPRAQATDQQLKHEYITDHKNHASNVGPHFVVTMPDRQHALDVCKPFTLHDQGVAVNNRKFVRGLNGVNASDNHGGESKGSLKLTLAVKATTDELKGDP
jgi:hypothetical protein